MGTCPSTGFRHNCDRSSSTSPRRQVEMCNYSVICLLAFLAQAFAGEVTVDHVDDLQDLDDTAVGMPSFLEREWGESAPARLVMVKAKVKAMKAAPAAMKAMKAAPKAKAKKAVPMKASKKAELQGELSFTQLALYGLVAAGAFSFGFGFRCKSLGVE